MANTTRIPVTLARLQPYVTILSGGQPIGNIASIKWEIDREVNVWRQLKADTSIDDPGVAIEAYPSKLPLYKLTIKKIVLYSQTFMDAFGLSTIGGGHDILGQRAPVDIAVQLPNLKDVTGINKESATNVKNYTVITFNGVWFKNLPMSFDVDAGDMKIEQEVEGLASSITVSTV